MLKRKKIRIIIIHKLMTVYVPDSSCMIYKTHSPHPFSPSCSLQTSVRWIVCDEQVYYNRHPR